MRQSWGVNGWYFHIWVAAFLSTMALIKLWIILVARGIRQGRNKQAANSVTTIPNMAFSPYVLGYQSPNQLPTLNPSHVWTGTWANFLILSVISSMTFPVLSTSNNSYSDSIFHRPLPQQLTDLNLRQTCSGKCERLI